MHFAETTTPASRSRRSAIATRVLPALLTAIAVVLVAAGAGGLGFETPVSGPDGAHQSAGGSTRGVRQSLAGVQRDPRRATRADRCQASATEPSGASRLPCPPQGYEHLQGPHRRAAIADRAAQQVWRSTGLLRGRDRAADRGIRRALPRHAGAAGRRAGLRAHPSRMSSISARRSRARKASMPQPPTRQAASASGFSLRRRTAIRTSAMLAPISTRAACRPARRKIETAAGRGPRSSRGSRRSILWSPPEMTRRRRASALATSGSITGLRCATG